MASGQVDGYYYFNVYIPFLDHPIMELETQFTSESLDIKFLIFSLDLVKSLVSSSVYAVSSRQIC